MAPPRLYVQSSVYLSPLKVTVSAGDSLCPIGLARYCIRLGILYSKLPPLSDFEVGVSGEYVSALPRT